MFKVLSLIILSIAGSCLYRAGGSSSYNTKFRDFGVPTVSCLVMWAWGFGHWSLVLCWLALFGACTTYFGFVNKWFGKPKEKKYWWNWMLCGLAYGLAALPVCWAFGLWWGFFYRMLYLAVLITLWSENMESAKWEEIGRGALIVASIPILLIH